MSEHIEDTTTGTRDVEVPYEANDLYSKSRIELVSLVCRQANKWPFMGSRKFSASKTTKALILSVLLNPEYGFTKVVPSTTPASVHVSPVADGQNSEVASTPKSLSEYLVDTEEYVNDLESQADLQLSSSQLNCSMSSNSEEESFHDYAEQQPLMRHVRLYINDSRRSEALAKTTCTIVLTDHGWWSLNYWCASAFELIQKLQMSSASLTGPIKLSYPDPNLPEYRQVFVVTRPGEALEDAIPNPSQIVISRAGTLRLTVEASQSESLEIHPNPINKMSRLPLEESQHIGVGVQHASTSSKDAHATGSEESISGLHCLKKRRTALTIVNSGQSKEQRRDRKSMVSNEQVIWLREQLSACEGYREFRERQNRIQQNRDIVASWTFAVEFCDAHFKAQHTTLAKETHCVTKKNIELALNVGATWMAEAEKAVRILRRFGKGGREERPEVVDMINLQHPRPLGSRVLLDFIRAQEE